MIKKKIDNDLSKWTEVIQKISAQERKRNRPLSVRRLIRLLKKLPPKAIVELRLTQCSKYKYDPIAFTGKMKGFGVGKLGLPFTLTLIAEREN